MKCPVCEEMDLKSKVFPGTQTTTLAMGESYYDEDGEWHDHDPNRTTRSFWCSQNHGWSTSSYRKCPSCDYQLKEKITIIRQ
jgi:hypothetical protein